MTEKFYPKRTTIPQPFCRRNSLHNIRNSYERTLCYISVSRIKGRICSNTTWRSQHLKNWYSLLASLSRRRSASNPRSVTAEWTTCWWRTQPWRCTNPTRAHRTQLHCHMHPRNTRHLHHWDPRTPLAYISAVIMSTSLWAAHRHCLRVTLSHRFKLPSYIEILRNGVHLLRRRTPGAGPSCTASRCEAGRQALFVCVLATL
jgi:hypothetical protein